MPKTDLGDVCGRYLSSRLSKQSEYSLSNDQQSIKHFLNNEHIATEHKRHTILAQKIFFKQYKQNPLDKLRQRYTIIQNNNNNNTENINNIIMPANNDVLLTAFNNNTTNGTNGTNSNHQYRSTYGSCSNGNTNGNHSSSPSSQSSSSSSSLPSNNSSSLMMNWELLKDRGSGLVNLGNTCFINASLQCLANTPPLVQWLLCNSHHQCCRVKLEKQFCLFCEAERIVKLIHSKNSNSSFSSSVGAANPNNIVRRIKDISTTFKVGRQEDASEFLICLIDKIVDACLRSSQPPERLRPSSGTSYEQLCHSQTIFHDLFGLVLRSRVVCSRCRHTSDTFEVQYSWIIGVRNHSELRQSLQQFVCRETLSGENLYRCIKCKQLVPAVKRYTLHKASKILLINLKRFEFGKNSHKLSHLVRYPEYLNVGPYMSDMSDENSTDQLLNYRLYAVLVHVGSSMHSGHYFSYVRSPNNRWYKADDTTMTQCDLNQVLTQHGAYILCYIKETPSSNNTTNGSSTTNTTPTTSKLVYQNGKLNNSEHQSTTTTNATFFTPRQVPVQNLPKQSM
jgi:ubiquitin C-terminal hydrolase